MGIVKRIQNDTFIRQVLTLAGGNIGGQLVLFISLPFLQRYFYSPQAFGLFTIYVSLSELLINISGLKYEYGIVPLKRHKKALNLLFTSLVTVGIISILTLLGYTAVYLGSAAGSGLRVLGMSGFLLPVSVLCWGTVNAVGYWFNREKHYGRISGSKWVSSLVSEPVKFGVQPQLSSGAGLITGRVAGQFAAFVYVCVLFWKHQRHYLRLYSPREMRLALKEQSRYPFYVMPGALITTLITALYVNFFSHYFGQEKTGILGVSVSYLGVAFGIVSGAFGQVFFRRISDENDYTRLSALFRRFMLVLSAMAAAVILLIYLFPNSWVTALLGERWGQTLPVMRIMVLWMSIAFVSSALSFIHIRLHNQRGLLMLEIVHLILVLAALFGSYAWRGDFFFTLCAFSLVQIIHYLAVILSAFLILKKRRELTSRQK